MSTPFPLGGGWPQQGLYQVLVGGHAGRADTPPQSPLLRVQAVRHLVAQNRPRRRLPFSNEVDADVGIDAKVGLTRSLTADFTYNTDFAQVEDDEQQVNLTRFSLFFPEKREFFLEGQGIFAFGGFAQQGSAARRIPFRSSAGGSAWTMTDTPCRFWAAAASPAGRELIRSARQHPNERGRRLRA